MNKYFIRLGFIFTLIVGVSMSSGATGDILQNKRKPIKTTTVIATFTPSEITLTPSRTYTVTPSLSPTTTEVSVTPTYTASPTFTQVSGDGIQPFPNALLCQNHNNIDFHTLWDNVLGCHYDHEHGQNPFTTNIETTFPNFNLLSLLGNVEIGHTNPSSPMENTHKHGGFKWDVTLSHSAGCETGVGAGNSAGIGVNAFVSQYHNFGDYSIEMETRQHSALILMRQCLNSNPTDYGYAFFNQLQDYGQRVIPYQGTIYQYPDTPLPAFDPTLSPYFTIGCYGTVIQCRPSRQFVLDRNANADSTWVSVPQAAPIGSPLFGLLFRVRDTYQLISWDDQVYPFTFTWLCSSNGGLNYSGTMANCRWNNSTSRIHEVHGTIPSTWDNTATDSDPRIGRITAEGFVTDFGVLNTECVEAGAGCHPFKLINAFVGRYRSAFGLVVGKGQFTPENLPERDIYFCNGIVCLEASPNAVPSGWIGQNN